MNLPLCLSYEHIMAIKWGLWDRSPSLFIVTRPEPFIDTNFLNLQKQNLAQHVRNSHECFHSLIKYLVISLGLLVYLQGFLAAKQTGFLKIPPKYT